MSKFVKTTLGKLNYIPDKHKQYAPHEWTVPVYEINRQFSKPQDISDLLPKKKITYVQKVLGSLYTMLGLLITPFYQLLMK